MDNYQKKSIKYYTFYVFFLLIVNLIYSKSIAQNTFVKTTHIKKLCSEVEANPENLNAHHAFINALNRMDPLLPSQYETWTKRYPKSSTTFFAIGEMYAQMEDPKARDYLLQAVTIKPDLAAAWNLLSIDAQRRGSDSLSNTYIEKAAKANPKNSEYALSYAFSFKDTNPVKYDSLALAVVRLFPNTEQAAQSLTLLAYYSNNDALKLAYFQQLYQMYLSHPTDWGRSGIGNYYNFLINKDPIKAFEIALSMVVASTTSELKWRHMVRIAKSFIDARNLLQSGKPEEAIKILATVDLNNSWSVSYIDAEDTLVLFKAEAADAAGRTQVAYDSLAVQYSNKPSDRLRPALLAYASKLGINENQVDTAIWKLCDKRAKQADNFSLQGYPKSARVSLNDYKGKVLLLTYWFPGCGPCRGEFPHFESVLKKFKDKQVAYVGINIDPSQDSYVIPFMKASGYSFTPLRNDPTQNKGYQPGAGGVPINYLIDQKGRIIYSRFYINTLNDERTLELMIKEVLAAKD